MKRRKSFLIAFVCLVFGFTATILVAQQAQDEFPKGEVGAGAKLVVTSVAGPTTATHNQTISVTYNVKNQGTGASGSYKVGLYLSTDNEIGPAGDRLLDKVTFSTGLAPGESKKTSTKILVPINGLSGKYYYGAVVGNSKKASSKQVSLVRYSLADDNDTVTDHQTSLVWQKADDGQVRTWAEARHYCAGLVLGGKADWRLPSTNELETIIDYTRMYPAIDPVLECRLDVYWSGSTVANSPDYAWSVRFYSGGVYSYDKRNDYLYVRCVRGGPVSIYKVPAAPTGVTATAGNAQAKVSFTAPSNGGSPIIFYTVTSSPGGITKSGISSPITVTGLTNGTAYTFTVKATNGVGTGPASSASNSVTPIAPAAYQVIPSKDGYSFAPASRTFSKARSDLNFTSRYVNNGDGTDTDIRTKLLWQQADDGVNRN